METVVYFEGIDLHILSYQKEISEIEKKKLGNFYSLMVIDLKVEK